MMGYFAKFQKSGGIDFMEGRDKADIRDIVDEAIHIVGVGFIKGDNGDFAVFSIKENDEVFYFAPSVISDVLAEIKEDGMLKELAKVKSYIRVNTSKKGREYYTIEFVEK